MKIRKIIVYLCVFATAASIFTRIIYVNKVYPSVKIHNYNIGDTVNTDEYQICLDSVKVYEKAEWENYIDSTQIGRERDSYKANDKDAALKMRYNPDEDYKVIETELLVKNISGERKTAVMGQLCSVNGIMQKMMMNYYYTRRLQPEGKIDSIVRTIEAGETQKWKCYYVVNNTDEELFFEYIKVGQINRISLNLHKS